MVHGDGIHRECAPPQPSRYRPGMGLPPSCVVHRRSVIDTAGPWRDYRGLDTHPDRDLWRRIDAAGARIAFVPRLTAVKFPAVWRRNVYRDKPSHEQARWLARIAAEPELEAAELARMIAACDEPRRLSGARYAEIARDFAKKPGAECARGSRQAPGAHWSAATRSTPSAGTRGFEPMVLRRRIGDPSLPIETSC